MADIFSGIDAAYARSGWRGGALQRESAFPGMRSTRQLSEIAEWVHSINNKFLPDPGHATAFGNHRVASWYDAQKAAIAITPLATRFLLENYDASGLGKRMYPKGGYAHSGWLRKAIMGSRMVVQWNKAKRTPVMRMEMPLTIHPRGDHRENAGTMIAGTLDAGRVSGAGKGLGARGKRTFKRMVEGKEVHFLAKRRLLRKSEALATAHVVLGKHFYRFTPQQKEQLRRAFYEAYKSSLNESII